MQGQVKHGLRICTVKIKKYLLEVARTNFSELLGNVVWG